jgi:hypothetical protein
MHLPGRKKTQPFPFCFSDLTELADVSPPCAEASPSG